MNRLEPWEELKSQQAAEGEGDFALTMAVNVLPIDNHLGEVTNDAFDH